MITKQFKTYLASILQYSATTPNALLPIKAINGNIYYLASKINNSFPYYVSHSIVFDNSYGIHLGSNDTPATEEDYNLKAQITSGLSVSALLRTNGIDANGNPYLELLGTLLNTTNSDIVIREVGYFQNLQAGTSQNATSLTNRVFMFDRTVLTSPLIVPANDAAALKYTLKTILPSS